MIELDFTNVHADAVGAEHGLTNADLAEEASRSGAACARLQEARRAGKLPFLDLPYQDALVERIRKEAGEWRQRHRNFLLLGIGGSALGPIALHTALCHRFHNLVAAPRLFVCDTVDPDETAAVLDTIDLRETLVNVVTKSGETAETLASFLITLARLKDRRAGEPSLEAVPVLREIVRRSGDPAQQSRARERMAEICERHGLVDPKATEIGRFLSRRRRVREPSLTPTRLPLPIALS